MSLSRRQFLASSALAATVSTLSVRASWAAQNAPLAGQTGAAMPLTVESRVLDVLGKAAKVYAIRQANGTPGLTAHAGDRFLARLQNRLDEPTALHWHGQTPPNAMDGVPGITQQPIAAGADFLYDFPLRPGTHWMHSHYGLQEQRLMAAPMVVIEDPGADVQEIVVLLHDFSFTDPAQQLAQLTGAAGQGMDHGQMSHDGAMAGMSPDTHADMHSGMHSGMASNTGMAGMAMPNMTMADVNDLEYDAYLANDRTLDDPQVTRVAAGGRVRLRLINGATSTAFTIALPGLTGLAVSVDGTPVRPLPGAAFPLAMGQRLDLIIDIPKAGGAWPVLALREGAPEQTGIILATRGAAVKKQSRQAAENGPLMSLDFESRLAALYQPTARPVDRRHVLTLEGSMQGYRWTLNGKAFGQHIPVEVHQGNRMEITFDNRSGMMHPMHLHGHAFQVVAIGGRRLHGALRDTVIVPSQTSVTVALDADNPGEWVMHCHNLFHMATGMMTTLKYV